MSVQYSYSKTVNIDQLTKEIQESTITTALDYIESVDSSVSIYMKASLSEEDEATLDNIVFIHSPSSSPLTKTVPIKQALPDTHPYYFGITGTTDNTGYLELLVQIPGTFNGVNGYPLSGDHSNGKYILFAEAKFSSPSLGDKITHLEAVDLDDVIGLGSGTVLGGYIDTSMPSENRCIYLKDTSWTRIEVSPGPKFLPSGVYMRIRLQKASSVADTVYINVFWNDND